MSEHNEQSAAPRRGLIGLRIAATLVLALSVVVFYKAVGIGLEGGFGPENPGFFPILVGSGLLVFGILFMLRATVWPDRELAREVAEESQTIEGRKVVLVAVCLLVYAALFNVLGYLLSTLLFFPAVARVIGSRRLVRDVVIGTILSVVLYLGFTIFLGVQLPEIFEGLR